MKIVFNFVHFFVNWFTFVNVLHIFYITSNNYEFPGWTSSSFWTFAKILYSEIHVPISFYLKTFLGKMLNFSSFIWNFEETNTKQKYQWKRCIKGTGNKCSISFTYFKTFKMKNALLFSFNWKPGIEILFVHILSKFL